MVICIGPTLTVIEVEATGNWTEVSLIGWTLTGGCVGVSGIGMEKAGDNFTAGWIWTSGCRWVLTRYRRFVSEESKGEGLIASAMVSTSLTLWISRSGPSLAGEKGKKFLILCARFLTASTGFVATDLIPS